jgi:hypothetical protein
MKLPIRSLGLLAAGLLVGSALAPVAAQQQQSGVDGQVAVRSDGAVYLISNGQRRWIATVQITDDELNAYPEGDPIFAGLGPLGSTGTTASAPPSSSSGSGSSSSKPQNPAPAASPQASTSPGSNPPASSSSSSSSSAQPTATPDSGISTDIPIELDVVDSSNNTFQGGDKIGVEIKTTKDNVCELSIKWPNEQEDNEDSKTADSRGKCRFNVDVPENMKEGTGKLKGWSRNAGKYNRMDVEFTIKNKS